MQVNLQTLPTPQSYNNKGLIIGSQTNAGQNITWEDDIESSGDKEDEGEGDHNSMQTDNCSNLAECLMSKEEKLSNLYNSLLEARNFVQALAIGGEIDDAKADQNITGCMMGLVNALLSQPYRVIMEQKAGLMQAVLKINKTMALLMTKIENNGERSKQMWEETIYNFLATTQQLKALETMTMDTQSCIAALEEKDKCTITQTTANTTSTGHTTSHASSPLYKPKGKTDRNLELAKQKNKPATAHHPCRTVIQFLPDGMREEDCLEPALIVSTINNVLVNSQSLKAKHIKATAAAYNNHSNLIVLTHTDQHTSDLLQYLELFLPLIRQGYETSAIEDKKWFKIQIDGVSQYFSLLHLFLLESYWIC